MTKINSAHRLLALKLPGSDMDITFSGSRIFIDKTEAGILYSEHLKNQSVSHIASLFEGLVDFSKWSLPPKFDYVYIDKFKLNNKYRDKGVGAQVLQTFFASFKKPTLFAMYPGEISPNAPIKSVLNFYKKNQMYLTKVNGEVIAFAFSEGYRG